MNISQDNFTRVNNDMNGNSRYVIHFTTIQPECFKALPLNQRYKATCKAMNKIGGRKYHNKSYGGGVVFQSYNLDRTIMYINDVIKEENAQFNNLVKTRKYYLYERILLDAANNEGFEDCAYYNELKTDKDKAAFLYGRFMSEYSWAIERTGSIDKAVQEWLQGLAINIPYMNYEILEIAGLQNASENKQNTYLEKYWPHMAMRLRGLWDYFDIR